jgi:hypothetical protein
MQTEYKAILTGDHLEWKGERPKALAGGKPAEVLVTVLEPSGMSESERRERGAGMAAALREIASRGGIKSIPDPVAWQREMREDKPQPGRE